jgi:hypothetical protein
MGTPTIQRPLKTGNVRTYVESVTAQAPNDAPILAPEVDADIDLLVNAWNNPASAFPPSGPAGGDLAGTFPNPTLRSGALPTTLPPSGAAGGDLAGSTYPNPVVAPGAITTAKLADGAAARVKIAADAWLPPIPAGADVGKVLGVGAGPALVYQAPPGGPPTGAAGGDLGGTFPNPTIPSLPYSRLTGAPTALPPNGAAGGHLTGTYPNPTVAAGVIAAAQLAVGATIRQINSKPIPTGSFNAGVWTAITTLPLTTSGGRVLLIAAAGWRAAIAANSTSIIFSVGFGRDVVTPLTATSVDHTVSSPTATGNLGVPLPMYVTVDSPGAGAHTYYLSCNVSSTAGFLVMEANAGQFWAIEFA